MVGIAIDQIFLINLRVRGNQKIVMYLAKIDSETQMSIYNTKREWEIFHDKLTEEKIQIMINNGSILMPEQMEHLLTDEQLEVAGIIKYEDKLNIPNEYRKIN